MAAVSSGKVNEEITTDRKSCSRTRSRCRDPDSKHRYDNEYHAKSRKRLCSHSYFSHDRNKSDKRGSRDNQKQSSKTGEKNASKDVTDLAFRVQRMEGFLEQIATHMGLSN